MSVHHQDDQLTIHHGDALEVLRGLPSSSVDVCITDPPYGLTTLSPKKVAGALQAWVSGDSEYVPAGGAGFMNASWDRFVPPPALWAEVIRVLKPGAYLASFAGARTQDLMGMSIRLAGFQIKDGLQWVRADSFAKTAHALKPGYEPIILAQKPLDGTAAANIEQHGTGGMNIDASRTPFVSAADEDESKSKNQHGRYGTAQGGNSVYGDYSNIDARTDYDAPGRWPANLLLDAEAATELDARHPSSQSRRGAPRTAAAGEGWGMTSTGAEYDDQGGPSRFFPKVHYAGRATVKERPVAPDGTKHPTVKPLSVMEWLVRLLAPANGVILDPFLGSGTTAEAALQQGFHLIGVEGNAAFLPLIDARIERQLDHFA